MPAGEAHAQAHPLVARFYAILANGTIFWMHLVYLALVRAMLLIFVFHR